MWPFCFARALRETALDPPAVGPYDLDGPSLCCCRQAANQFAAAFRHTSLNRDLHAIDVNSGVGRDDFVDPMRFSARIEQRAADLIAQSGDCTAMDGVNRRAADDGAAVIRFVAYRDDYLGHVCSLD